MHSGLVVQAPRHQVRPYFSAGVGWGYQSVNVTFNGVQDGEALSGGVNSLTFGGGLRILFPSQNMGVRFGLEGLGVAKGDSETMSYGRFVIGVFKSFEH